MRHRWKWLPLLLLATILLVGTFAVASQRRASGPKKPQPIPIGDYTYAGALAEHRLQQAMKQHHIPGMSAALILDQQIVWRASYGFADLEQEIPVTEQTVFKMWSLSKPFTAVETMRLVEEGLVDLDTPITEYIPDFTIRSRFPEGEPITIRHILAHRSGLPRNECVKPDWHYGPDALDHLVVSLKECFLAYPTGERYKYTNAGYDLLGYIIQDQRQQPFPVYMNDHLLALLDMENSTFWSSDLFGSEPLNETHKATGYEFYEGEFYAYEQNDVASIPSSNLYATIGDLSNFVQFIFRGGEANGSQLLSPTTLASMFDDPYSHLADPQRIGLGWRIGRVSGSEKMLWHDGGPSEGIGSLVAFLPERKMGVILVANSTSFEGPIAVPLAIELLEAMLETEHIFVAPVEAPAETVPLETAAPEAYEGDYALMEQIMTVSLNGDKLQGSIAGMSFDLVPLGKNHLRVTHWLYKLGLAGLLQLPMDLTQLEIEFQPGAEPQQDTMIVDFGGIFYEIAPRYPDSSEFPPGWEALAGTYERYERLPSGSSGQEKLGQNEITIVDGRLQMTGSIGPIAPIDDTTILILSGPFNGETITPDTNTGYLYHQGFVYKPRANTTDAGPSDQATLSAR